MIDLIKSLFDILKTVIGFIKDLIPWLKSLKRPYNKSVVYRKKWTEPLFMNNGGNGKHKVCPCDIHIPCRWSRLDGDKWLDEEETVDEESHRQELERPGGKLVMGDPGIGKSTLISWYLNLPKGRKPVRVYRLAELMEELDREHPGTAMMKLVGEPPRNAVLFLDGLDECDITAENRRDFLVKLANNWEDLTELSWVVTCRWGYLSDGQKSEESGLLMDLPCSVLKLLPFSSTEIECFLERYEKASGQSVPQETREALRSEEHEGDFGSVFGIPLILYLVTAGGIRVREDSTLVQVYDQLFDLDKGVLYNARHDKGHHEQSRNHKPEIHQMSRDIALWMLLYAREDIPRAKYEEIGLAIGEKVQIGHYHSFSSYFRSFPHNDGYAALCFIHRTMYEYFVAEGFAALVRAVKDEEGKWNPKELSRMTAWYWSAQQMGLTQRDYVAEKLAQIPGGPSLKCWEQAGEQILAWCESGLPEQVEPVPGRKQPVPACLAPKTGGKARSILFWNLGVLLNDVRQSRAPDSLIFSEMKNRALLDSAIRRSEEDDLILYCPNYMLLFAQMSEATLIGADLRGADLRGANLTCTVLIGAHLNGADLNSAHLTGANLTGVNLTRAHLTGAHLADADLTGANLTGARLTDANLTGANLTRANLSGARITNANLTGARLTGANLTNADLTDADLTGAKLIRANLSGANLTGANLTRAYLTDANLNDANLTGANLTRVHLTREAVNTIGYRTLSTCIFSSLNITNHKGTELNYSKRKFFQTFFRKRPLPD